MTPELVERADRLIVSAPYNRRWSEWARDNGGKWDAGSMAWVFHVEQRQPVEEAVARIFGLDCAAN